MNDNLPRIILWIQNTPNLQKTVLSDNGKELKSGSTKYITLFNILTKIELEKYNVLTPTLKRYSYLSKESKKHTFLSGHFQQTDESNRQICFRAFIINAKNKNEECRLLEEEARRYGCSISEEDQKALKKKKYCIY